VGDLPMLEPVADQPLGSPAVGAPDGDQGDERANAPKQKKKQAKKAKKGKAKDKAKQRGQGRGGR
jgi:hypothetical protein